MTRTTRFFRTCIWLVIFLAAEPGVPVSAVGQEVSLDGTWSLAVDTSGGWRIGEIPASAGWRPITVPGSWQAQCGDLRDYHGVAWYKRSFEVAAPRPTETVLLRFGAVDYRADVFLNGRLLGSHEGGYTPFELDAGPVIVPGRNEILVRVMDPSPGGGFTEGVRYAEIPHGKQSWYVQTSGLWQSVRASLVPKRRVTRVRVTSSVKGEVHVEIALAGTKGGMQKEMLRVGLADPSGKECTHVSVPVAAGAGSARAKLSIAHPLLWDIDRPNLYTAHVTFAGQSPVVERFGFRSIETRDGRLLLNGTPFFMMGALDQDFYPQTVYTTPSREFLRDEMLKARRIGLNTLRCHIKVPDPRYLEVADEVGILVWYEIPNWAELTPDARRRSRETLDGMLARDWNHPSLVIISLINESWGIDLQKEDQRRWLKEEFLYAKGAALGRLVVDNSACWGNFHMATDINDYHTYWAIPENKDRFDTTVADFATRPPWLFSTFGDARETRQEPLVMSEFGNWGLPDPPLPYPWWLDRPFFDAGTVHPKGFLGRFAGYRYREVFGNYSTLSAESQRAQTEALKYEIESLRLAPQLSGYIITEFTDINWESNGVLDMWRRVKHCGELLANLQQQTMVIPRPRCTNVWADSSATIDLRVSHFGANDIGGARVVWSATTGSSGSFGIPSCRANDVTALPAIQVPAAACDAPSRVRVSIEVRDSNDGIVARNYCDYFIYPRPSPVRNAMLQWHDPSGALSSARGALQVAGSKTQSVGEPHSVTITNRLDTEVQRILRDGGSVLCLVDSQTTLPAGFPLTIIRRDTGGYDGNWASNLNWIRPANPAVGWIPSVPRLGFETSVTGLPLAIGNVPAQSFDDVLAGLFVGWVHNSAGYIVQMAAGNGVVVLCSIPIARCVGDDPFAATLFARLVDYAAGSGVVPRLQWSIQ